MSQKIAFTKMQGAGNDYIYVDTTRYDIPNPGEAAVVWSRPHFGIGSDGLVLIGRADDPAEADFTMRIFNADGSEARMCGNASRCIGKYLYEKGLTRQTEIRLKTLSGVKTLRLTIDGGHVARVTVDMLEPRFVVAEQFVEEKGYGIFADGKTFSGVFVSMGNPHYVIFVNDVEQLDVARYGKVLERADAFPERCNIEFAEQVDGTSFRTRVWERGSGITMACGTGACATAVAAAKTGRAPRQSKIIMDGGTLSVDWQESDNHVLLGGPAAFVFEGEIEL